MVVSVGTAVAATTDGGTLNSRFPESTVPIGSHIGVEVFHYNWTPDAGSDTCLTGVELRWSAAGERWAFRATLPGLGLSGPGSILALGPGSGRARSRDDAATGGQGAALSSPAGPGGGSMTLNTGGPTTTTETGVGDLRLETVRRLGHDTPAGQVRARAGVKLPTADESQALGTGETDFWAGFDWLRQGWTTDVEAYVEWVRLGDLPDLPLQDGPAAGLFLGWPLGRGGLRAGIDAARAAVPDDPARVRGVAGGHGTVGREGVWIAAVSAGLTDSAPDFGLSLAFRY